MSQEQSPSNWVRLSECPPSDLFVCNYSGNFSQLMEVNLPSLETFLERSAIGTLTLSDKPVSRNRPLPGDLNIDGSITSKRGLFFGEKIEDLRQSIVEKRTRTHQPTRHGWVMYMNGDKIREKVVGKNSQLNASAITDKFAGYFNHEFNKGLNEILIVDKFSLIKDKYFFGRLVGTGLYFLNVLDVIARHRIIDNIALSTAFIATVTSNAVRYYLHNFREDLGLSGAEGLEDIAEEHSPLRWVSHSLKIFNFSRRNVKSLWEIVAPPVEFDRFLISESYLQSKRLLRQPLIRSCR